MGKGWTGPMLGLSPGPIQIRSLNGLDPVGFVSNYMGEISDDNGRSYIFYGLHFPWEQKKKKKKKKSASHIPRAELADVPLNLEVAT